MGVPRVKERVGARGCTREPNLAAVVVFVLCAACSAGGTRPGLSGRDQAVVYGTDDRKDVYELDGGPLVELARFSTLALIPHNRLLTPAGGGVQISSPPLSDTRFKVSTTDPNYYKLCAGEPFLDEPAAADCTGVLIDDDLVLTAAHCFDDKHQCTDYSFVFDYFEEAPGKLAQVDASDVYACRQIVAHALTPQPVQVDFAIVQLDRAPLGRTPVKARLSQLSVHEPLGVVSFPSGIPAKIDTGVEVVSLRTGVYDYFQLNSDTFAGSSGSGVFDAEGQLVGVLVRGSGDFDVVMRDGQKCLTSKVGSDEAGVPSDSPGKPNSFEEATHVNRAIEGLCDLGYPSARLCRLAATCGDGFCTGAETLETCSRDCTAELCDKYPCGKHQLPVMLGDVLDSGMPDDMRDAGTNPSHDAGMARTQPGGCTLHSSGRTSLARWLMLCAGALAVRRNVRRKRF
jgi:V8-like Glu-specific endopeptidase